MHLQQIFNCSRLSAGSARTSASLSVRPIVFAGTWSPASQRLRKDDSWHCFETHGNPKIPKINNFSMMIEKKSNSLELLIRPQYLSSGSGYLSNPSYFSQRPPPNCKQRLCCRILRRRLQRPESFQSKSGRAEARCACRGPPGRT